MFKYIYGLIFTVVYHYSALAYAQDIVYAAGESDDYYPKLLSQALSYFPEKNYQVKRYGLSLPKQRSFDLLAKDKGVDVMNGSSTLTRENKYQAIYFPILRGLKGWRLALINQNTPELFANVKTEQQFKTKIPVQFHSWTATKIFESNNIKVAKAATYKGLFQMLDKNRIDYLPRSILDIKHELTIYPKLKLMIDPYILIKYPNAYYFYVNKDNHELANDIKQGLEKSLADGSFERLFNEAFGDEIASFNLKKRQVFYLNNPYLSATVPLHRTELWADHLFRN